MTRENIDLYNVGTSPEQLQAAVLRLREDFESHIHDGVSSRAFQTLTAETVSARAILVRKTSFTDSAAGIWMGMVGSTMKLSLGDATNYLQWTGSALNIVGVITATSGTIGGFTIGSTTISGGSSLVLDSTGTGIITGGLIRTSSSGERIQLDAANKQMVLINSSGSTVAKLNYGTVSTNAILTITPLNDSRGSIYITQASGNSSTTVDIANQGTGILMNINQAASGNTQDAIVIANSGGGRALSITQTGTSALNHGIYLNVRPDVTSYTNASGIYVDIDSNAVGRGIYVVHPSSNVGVGIEVDRSGNTAGTLKAMKITATNSGAGLALGIDFTGMAAGKRVFAFSTDATDPTGGGGAATGRIAIDIGGALKYLAYY